MSLATRLKVIIQQDHADMELEKRMKDLKRETDIKMQIESTLSPKFIETRNKLNKSVDKHFGIIR